MAHSSALDRWQGLSPVRKVLVICLGLAGLGAGLWYGLFQPQVQTIQSLHRDIDQLDQNIAKYRQQLKVLPKLKKKLAAQRKELILAKTLLPETSSDAENLLSSIEKLGNDVGIDFLLFSPGKERKHDFYASRMVRVRFQGTFHNLMRFFTHLSGLDRLVTLESIQLRPVSKASPEGISLQADCRISIYRILSDQEITDTSQKS